MSLHIDHKNNEDVVSDSDTSTDHINKPLFAMPSHSSLKVKPSCQTLVDQLQIISISESIGRSLGDPPSFSWCINLDDLYSYNYPSFYHQIVELHPPWATVYDNIIQKEYSPAIYGFVDRDVMVVILSTTHFKKKCHRLRSMDPGLPPDKHIVREVRLTVDSIPNNSILLKRDPSTKKFRVQLNDSEQHSHKHHHQHTLQDQSGSLPPSQPSQSMDDDNVLLSPRTVQPSFNISCLNLPSKSEVLQLIGQEYEVDPSTFKMISSDYYADVSS